MLVAKDLINHAYIAESQGKKNPKQRGLKSFWVGGQNASMILERGTSQTPETEVPVCRIVWTSPRASLHLTTHLCPLKYQS